MFNLFVDGFIEDDCNYVEAERSVIDFMFGEEKSCGLFHPGLFGKGDYVFGGCEVLVFAGFDFDENYCSVGVGHNEVDFTIAATEVMVEEFEAFFLQVGQTIFFTPFAASIAVGWCVLSFEKPCKHLFGLDSGMFAMPL